MPAPLVSCIVPAFNAERFLADALASIAAQAHPRTETIVVDDGSTDATAEVLHTWADRVRVLTQRNSGAASARNAGIHVASGEFVAFLDADDLWRPEKIERQLLRFAQRPELGVCVARVATFHDGAALEMSLRRPATGSVLPAYAASTLMARRALFDRVGSFDASLRHADDTEWFLRARALGVQMESIDEVLVDRRLHSANMSLTQSVDSLEEYLRVIKAHLDRRRSAASPGPGDSRR
jgi:glycosyltransferase involved in cell wall biosynthesis